jgi:hypothetical protein
MYIVSPTSFLKRFYLEVREVGGRERGQGMGLEMAQTMYAHMNKQKKEQFVDIYSLLRL